MALDYSLILEADLESQSALKLILPIFDFKQCEEEKYLFGINNLLIGSCEESELSKSIIEEDFGFRPSFYVWFRIRSNDDEDRKGRAMMTEIVLEVLHQIPGNAVLLFNGETMVLQRIAGEVTLTPIWHNLIPQPTKVAA
jgi:hypothetical protein